MRMSFLSRRQNCSNRQTRCNAKPNHRSGLHLEPLEARNAPAGVVTTAQVGSVLTITGVDDLTKTGVLAGNNDQSITVTGAGAGAVNIAGVGGTIISGSTSFTGITDIKLDMRLGNDTVTATGVNLTGNVTFLGDR